MARNTFYITTPIYYPSDRLHIGHAYTTVAADALARFKRLLGYDVLFLTGTDEHGQKIARRARAAGKEPPEFVTEVVATIKDLWRRLNISHDDFIRTTEPRHRRVVQAVFRGIYERGDIYKGFYEGWYCTECEAFLLERQLADGLCPDCGRKVERVKEESYFFRLSKYQDRLLEYIEKHPEFIQPVSRRHEMINFIQGGLEDLSVSRTTFDWGIPVPGSPGHVVYVWFDALTNYVTGAGYLQDEERFAKYWPADVHLVGKEIVRFHTVIWPIILMALGLELPRCVFGHGWLVLEGGKMSKSKGNVVDPLVLIDKYGVDAVRYYLLREIPFGADGYYTEDALVQRINSDLANDYGNLLHRTLAMVSKYFGGAMPPPSSAEGMDEELRAAAAQAPEEMAACMDRLELSNALGAIWKLVAKANKYADETSPWALAHQPGQRARLGTVLYNLCESIRIASVLLSPFLPQTAARVWEQLGLAEQADIQTWQSARTWGRLRAGTPVGKGEVIFPRVEREEEKREGVEMISLEEFRKVDLRVAEVIAASKVKGTDKLLRLEVSLGEERRQIVAGIAEHYLPERLVGKKVIVVANLKPAKIRGLESAGMLLAAVDGDRLVLATVDGEIAAGTALS